MSELYRSDADSADEPSGPVAETTPAARPDHEPARDAAARQRQDNAAIEARLDEAGLPTRAESRAAALRWDAADEDDEGHFSPESNAAIEARLPEAGLPTRAESRAAALRWDADDEGDEEDFSPESNAAIEARLPEAGLPTRAESRAAALRWAADGEDDEGEFSPESNGAIEARPDEAGLPTRAESRAAALRPEAADEDDDYDDDQAAEYNGVLGALTVEGHAPDTGTSDRDQAAARDAPQAPSSPDDQRAGSPDGKAEASAEVAERADAQVTELLTELEVVLGEEGAGDLRAQYERLVRGDQESPDAPSAGTADDGTVAPAGTTEQTAVDTGDSTTEVGALVRKEVAEVEARPGKEIPDLPTHLERPEQRNQERPDAPIPPTARDIKKLPRQKTKPEHRWMSSDAQAVLGVTIAGYVLSHMVPGAGDVLKNIGDALPVGALAIPVWREKRKEKNVGRSED